MIDCRLVISSRGRGWKSDIVRPARMELGENSARIEYELEGDSCLLVIGGGRAEHIRKGQTDIRMTFLQGSDTACILGGEAFRGGYKIFTVRLKSVVKSHGVSASIEYLSGGDMEPVTVNIRAVALSKQDNFNIKG